MLLPANPCSGVEFPVAVKGLFRPHYVKWSEQLRIEACSPQYLRNVIRIITETGLRIYKELTSMRKDQVDVQNAFVWIPDSKTPSGIAEVPLSLLALEAFKSQIAIAGQGPFLFSERSEFERISNDSQNCLAKNSPASEGSLLPNLRSPVHVCNATQCRRSSR
jgi:integrase